MISVLVDYLSGFYQAGNLAQLEVIARNMLAAVPKDVVSLPLLGLALYQMGRFDDAHQAFKRVAVTAGQREKPDGFTECELAHVTIFRASTREHSGLADGWYRIALALNRFGLHQPAARVSEAALAARRFSGT